MNFTDLLNWISGKRTEPQPVAPASSRERRRFFRLDLTSGEVFLGDQGPFSVVNLSYGGLRLSLGSHEIMNSASLGTTFDARIRLGYVQFSCVLSVCNLGKDELGCSFVNLNPAHGKLLSDFLKPRILGASLAEIDAAALQNRDPNLRLRWFQGEEGAQIFLWQTLEGDTIKEEFYFLDYIISFDQQHKTIQTGTVPHEERSNSGFGRIDQGAAAFFKVPSHRALKLGRIILESAHLPTEVKDNLLAGIVREERRLYSRFIVGEKDPSVRFLLEDANSQVFSVANLSAKGIAFLIPDDDPRGEKLLKTKEVTGILEISQKSQSPITHRDLPARVKFVYSHEEVIGGSFELSNPSDAEFLAAFLAARLLGQSLEEVPPPSEIKAHAPPGSRAYLFIGVHNTHILTLSAPKNRLVFGRIAFMDKALVYERNLLSAYSCPRGIIFPSDWDLPLESVERVSEDDLTVFRNTCFQMLESTDLPEEVFNSWKLALSKPG